MSELSLFTNFSHGENRVSNYCGLMLKILYQEAPESFESVIAQLVADSGGTFEMMPTFEQQKKKKTSIPDLCISQKAFHIYIETKTTDWFYEDQIERHIDGMLEEITEKDSGNNILFLLTSEFAPNRDEYFKPLINNAMQRGVILQMITFEGLLAKIKEMAPGIGNYYASMLEEFEAFLDSESLLPKWQQTLDIINCGGTKSEVENGMYACPDSGGAYKHQRAKFFGAYWEKRVNYVAIIRAIVVIERGGGSAKVKWNNTNEDVKALCAEAREKISRCEEWRRNEVNEHDLQVFLFGDLHTVDYQKESKGGMMNSKIYQEVEASDIESLCNELNGKTWK